MRKRTHPPTREKVRKNIIEQMETRGWSYRVTAQHCEKIDHKEIEAYCKGKKGIRTQTLYKIALAFEIPFTTLLAPVDGL